MRHYILLILTLFLAKIGYSQNEFITTWNTTNSGTSDALSITIPTYPGLTYDYEVDWDNDGNIDEMNINGSITHTFPSPGIYTIRITGDFPSIYFNEQGDTAKIISIDQWGNTSWQTMENAFSGTPNLSINATDAPDLSGVTSLASMFKNSSMNQNINHWNTSTITDISYMFMDNNTFNQPLNDWDVSNVTTIASLFYGAFAFDQPLNKWQTNSLTEMDKAFYHAKSFNQNISSWDVSGVTNMQSVFYRAEQFDQPLNTWIVDNVTNMSYMFSGAANFDKPLNDWKVNNVTTMQNMFTNASKFNQDITGWQTDNLTNTNLMFYYAHSFNQDISSWNMSKVTDMTGMFLRNSGFDQDLGQWDISSVTTMRDMFSFSKMSLANYDKTLIGWNNQSSVPQNIELGADNLSFCNANTSRDSLIDKGWNIVGDTEDCPSQSTLPIEILHFNGLKLNNNIQLHWATTSEKNNAGFEVQKSEDGTNWNTIHFEKGQGNQNAQSNYQYLDTKPIVGTNYYRLKQIDTDGQFEFSNIIAVDFDGKQNDLFVFPNPSQGIVNVRINNPSQEDIIMRVYDQIGNSISQSQITDTETLKTRQVKIDGEGNYFISIQIGNKHLHQKVTILDDKY